ncbi:MAG: hypothetical protein KC652_11180 [Cyanobacteria bacterium HKST-UBA01]|nr:hypothetical protein [Cyanobacteria bacterium HKST-UBA01]
MKYVKSAFLASLPALFLVSFVFASPETNAQEKKSFDGQDMVFRGETKKSAKDVKELRRVDFKVEGSACASCLRRIRERMEAEDGVVEAAVMIKKPYGAAAIYDGSKIKVDKILKAALKGEKVKVKITEVNDRAIEKMPFILVPTFNQLNK